jgi:Ser-tRNA(Ala) deacylase AlaX
MGSQMQAQGHSATHPAGGGCTSDRGLRTMEEEERKKESDRENGAILSIHRHQRTERVPGGRGRSPALEL